MIRKEVLMWILILILLLFGAHLNLTALIPLAQGQTPPPWWVGGKIIWPFDLETRTLIPPGDALNTLTPILGVAAAVFFLLAALALLRWLIPAKWFRGLLVLGAACSIVLQIVWISPWAVLPLLVDAALLGLVFSMHLTVVNMRKPKPKAGTEQPSSPNI